MAQFVFQPGGGADAAYTHACITRAYHAHRGELAQRDEVITTIQAHPCNAATAAAAGFKVITLPLEDDGYPSVAALEAAVSERTAALMVNNPDDMGIYNPHIKRWVRDRPRRRRPRLLRPRELQRRDEPAARPRARLRRLHVHAAQDLRRAEGRRRPRGRRLRLLGGAGAVPAAPAGPARRRPLPTRARRRAQYRPRARVLGERAPGRQGLLLGAGDGRRRASGRPPTSRCSPTTTWRRGCWRSAGSPSPIPS